MYSCTDFDPPSFSLSLSCSFQLVCMSSPLYIKDPDALTLIWWNWFTGCSCCAIVACWCVQGSSLDWLAEGGKHCKELRDLSSSSVGCLNQSWHLSWNWKNHDCKDYVQYRDFKLILKEFNMCKVNRIQLYTILMIILSHRTLFLQWKHEMRVCEVGGKRNV